MRILDRWSRVDERLLELGLKLAVLLVGVFGLLLPVLGVAGVVGGMDTREVSLDGTTRVSGVASDGGVALAGTDRAELTVTDPDLGQRVLLALPEVVGASLIVLVLLLLLRVADTLRAGDVFVGANAVRLRLVAVAVLVFGAVQPLVEAITTDVLVQGTELAESVPFSYAFSFGYVLLTFLIAALAEAFRHGARLRADTEGLV